MESDDSPPEVLESSNSPPVATPTTTPFKRQPLFSKASKTRKTKRSRKSLSKLAPQAQHVVSSVSNNQNFQPCASVLRSRYRGSRFAAFHASALSKYPKFPSALKSTSKRVHIPARVNNHPVSEITIDTAADVPCISATFLKTHPTLKNAKFLPVPPGAIRLNSADGSPP